nr:RNA-directed DNA polymerase, eukaryota [Tanacetum cinerariifolium]
DSVPIKDAEVMAKSVGCGVANFPLKYLAHWKARLLSVGGRLSLIKFVLGNLPTYHLSMYMMPTTIQKKLEGIDLLSLYKRKLGNGALTTFWDDIWCGNIPLKTRFPRIYMLDYDKVCSVSNRLHVSDWSFILRRIPRGEDPNATRWNRCIPIKVNVFLWRLFLNKLPTRVNLNRKGIDVASTLCPICCEDVKTVKHIFFSCEMAKDLWALTARWWELDIPICSNILEWCLWIDSLHLYSKAKSLLEEVGGKLMWSMWRFRNQLVFSIPPPKKTVLWDFIVSQYFLWISSRNPKFNLSWNFVRAGEGPNLPSKVFGN